MSPPLPSSRVVAHLNANGERAARVTVSRHAPTSTSTPRLASTLAVTDPSKSGHPTPPPIAQALFGGYFDDEGGSLRRVLEGEKVPYRVWGVKGDR